MQTITINNPKVEKIIFSTYGNDKISLLNDFISFIETKEIMNDIKKGFHEVSKYENKQTELTNANDFLDEIKHK